MSWLNAPLRGLFDAVLFPFRSLHPWIGLGVLSALVGVAMLLLFKATSDQKRLEATKRQIFAGLFELRLFNDDFRAILRAQAYILRHNLRYLGLTLKPMLFALPPLVLVVAQLQFHYGYRGLAPGETTRLTVRLKEGAAAATRPRIDVEVPEGVRLDSAGVWAPAVRFEAGLAKRLFSGKRVVTFPEMTWRIAAERPGSYALRIMVEATPYDKTVVVSEAVVRRSPIRPAPSFVDQLIYPAEPPVPAEGPVAEIRLAYRDAGTWLGIPSWMIFFFVASLVFAYALKGRFGVTL